MPVFVFYIPGDENVGFMIFTHFPVKPLKLCVSSPTDSLNDGESEPIPPKFLISVMSPLWLI